MGTLDASTNQAIDQADLSADILRLKAEIQEGNAQLEAQQDRLRRLDEEARRESERSAALQEQAQALTRERDEAAARLQAAYKQGSDLHIALEQELAQARRRNQEEDRRLQQEAEQALLEQEKCSRLQQEAVSQAERFSFERDARKKRAQQLEERHQYVMSQLNGSLQQAEQLADQRIELALSQWETARVQQEAAASRLHLAQTSLQETEDRLAQARTQLAEREQNLRVLEQQQKNQLNELQEQYGRTLSQLASRQEAAQRELEEKQSRARHVSSLAELSQSALEGATSHMEQFSEQLRELYSQTEAETAAASEKMDGLIRQVMERKELVSGLQSRKRQLDQELASAQSAVSRLNGRFISLQAEDQDIRSAARLANDLAREAEAACENADPELKPVLTEMAETLLSSAREARAQAEAKSEELRQARLQLGNARAELSRAQSSQQELDEKLNQAESGYQEAERSLTELSDQVERLVSGRKEKYDRAQAAREEYEAIQSEVRSLKETVLSSTGELRQLQLDEGRLRNELLQIKQQTASLNAEQQRRSAQLTRDMRLRLDEAASQAAIGRDSLNILLLQQEERQAEFDLASAESREASQREQQLKEQLETCRSQEAAIAQELREQIARENDESEEALSLTRKDMEQAIARLDQATERMGSMSQGAEQARSRAAALKSCRDEEALRYSRQVDELKSAFIANKRQNDLLCDRLRHELAQAQSAMHLAYANALLSQERAAAGQAGREAAATAVDSISARLDRDGQDLISLRREEARLQAEENARRVMEMEEAAHAAALAEQARIAQEKADRAAKFEEETVQMASGRRLEREQLLELLENGGLEDRVQRINELAAAAARNSDFRYMTDKDIEKLRVDAEFFQQQAEEEAQLFQSSRLVLNSLKEKQERLKSHRRRLAPLLAAAMSQSEKATQEQDAILAAQSKLARADAKQGDEMGAALDQAGSGLDRALEAARCRAESCNGELASLQRQIADYDRQLAAATEEYEQAVATIEDLTARWLYKESSAASARADLAEVDRTAAQREEYRRRREEASAQARNAAQNVARNPRSLMWRRRKRG